MQLKTLASQNKQTKIKIRKEKTFLMMKKSVVMSLLSCDE